MEKSPEAFRTISEVADFLDTPAHVLRFWESRFPQIRPVKRAGGRRYYRPSDVALLAGIRKLLHDDGMTIRGVQKILREHGIRHVAALGNGEDPALFADADVDAALPPDVTMQDRFALPDTPEALQTAQIISLEAALGRGEASRPVEPELPWPSAEEDMPSALSADSLWPQDPEDTVEGVVAAEAHDDTGTDNPAAEHEPSGITEAAGDVPDMEEGPAMPASMDAMQGAEEAGAEVAGAEEAGAEVAGAEDAPTPIPDAIDAHAAESASPAAAPVKEPAVDAPVGAEEVVVAALLRRADAAHLQPVQDELKALRDRLILLRTRVADAARRRVK